MANYFNVIIYILVTITTIATKTTAAKRLPKCLNSSVSFTGLPAQLIRKYFGCEPENKNTHSWMTLHRLENTQTSCNDGSRAGYYLRRNTSSKTWLVFLEGGWYCYNEKTCLERVSLSRRFSVTSSYKWSPKKDGDGILSPDKLINPTWSSANHVYIPYCSSDVWTGNSTRVIAGKKFHFHGSRILEETIRALLKKGLDEGNRLLFAGSSAGGAAVMLNIDRLSNIIEEKAPGIDIRGLVDSGWFLDNKPMSNVHCNTSPELCATSNSMGDAVSYWDSVLPTACTANKTDSQRHLCYYGYVLYPTVKRPIMLFNWLYDIAQIINDNKGLVTDPKQLFSPKYVNYILKLGKNLRTSLEGAEVSAAFAPSCIAHTVLTKRHWLRTRVEGSTLDDAMRCWFGRFNPTKDINATTLLSSQPIRHCSYRLIDSCEMPQCNTECPPIQDPMTGAEINISQLLLGANAQITLPANLPHKKLLMLQQMLARLGKTPES